VRGGGGPTAPLKFLVVVKLIAQSDVSSSLLQKKIFNLKTTTTNKQNKDNFGIFKKMKEIS